MSLSILYRDELTGFARSRVMLVLWLGMPAVALLINILQPDLQGQMPLTTFSMFIVSTISSTIASVMLSVGIIHEKSRGVYALFLVRPVKRRNIILAKFFSVFTCIVVAGLFTLLVGVLYDTARGIPPGAAALGAVGQSAATGLATIAITSAAGILIGVLSPSVLVGTILVVYGANQLSLIGFIPVLLKLEPGWVFSLAAGVVFSSMLLALSVVFFNRKQF
jgi:ABC-2 type transport system permease protein